MKAIGLGWFYHLLDSMWEAIATSIFVRFGFELPIERIREDAKTKKLTFVLNHGGFFEWLILSSWCKSQNLGGIVFANRWYILALARPSAFFQIFFRRRTYEDIFLSDLPGLRLIFMTGRERSKLHVPTPSEKLLSSAYAQLSQRREKAEISFLPVFILWRKHIRSSNRNLSEYLFGLSSSPNWIGKIWFLIRRRQDSVVRSLTPIPLELTDRSETMDESESMRVAKQTRRRILVAFNQESRVVLGARYRSASLVKETLLRDTEVQALIDELSKKENIDRKKLMSRAYSLLTEIVSNYSFRVIEVMYVLLTWLFSKVFDGLDYIEEEWQQLREVMKHKAVVFVPCHRSHLDYLVIPHMMFGHDMATPYVAAGVNLSFWPLGPWLRAAGAFFIRRSFRGDLLYSLLLKKYVHYLLQNRFNLKFFIEGTRSRSGKMLAPSYGMLKMILTSCSSKAVEDVAIVPVSICYDEVPEQGSYTKELTGGQKVKEDATQLLKSRKIIRRRFGKVYVRLGNAMFLREILDKAQASNQDDTLTLQKTAFQISKTICDITPITAKSIVSLVSLTAPKEGISYEDLLQNSEWLAKYVRTVNMPLSNADTEVFHRSLEQTVRRQVRAGTFHVTDELPRRYICETKRRPLLNFYKNNSMHCFVVPAIASLATADQKANGTDFHQSAEQLRDLLKFDFFFNPRRNFEKDMQTAVDFLNNSPPNLGQGICMRSVGELMESYQFIGMFLTETGETQWDKKALTSKLVKFAESRMAMNAVLYPESISVYNFNNALQWYDHKGWLVQAKTEQGTIFKKTAGQENEELLTALSKMNRWIELGQMELGQTALPTESFKGTF